MKKAIFNAVFHTGESVETNKVLVVENGTISALEDKLPEDAEPIDAQGAVIAPGFFDIQINGGAKYYFTEHPDERTIDDIYTASFRTGTTHVLPCLISSPHETVLKGIEAVKNYMEKHKNGVVGLHLEGPYLHPGKKGAHVVANLRKPTNTELEEIIKYGKGVVKLITIAPEQFEDDQLLLLMEAGIHLSIGHSTLTAEQTQHYFNKGINLVTHLYNAMTPFTHREPGITGAALVNDNVYTPIILDGKHCDYMAAELAYKIKKDKLFLITDSSFLGREVKSYAWGDFNAHLDHEGFYRNNEGSLAGASISMLDAVENAVNNLGISVEEAFKMASSRVANALPNTGKIGYLKYGYPAAFVRFKNEFKQAEGWLVD